MKNDWCVQIFYSEMYKRTINTWWKQKYKVIPYYILAMKAVMASAAPTLYSVTTSAMLHNTNTTSVSCTKYLPYTGYEGCYGICGTHSIQRDHQRYAAQHQHYQGQLHQVRCMNIYKYIIYRIGWPPALCCTTPTLPVSVAPGKL